jgi:hypothetical protein
MSAMRANAQLVKETQPTAQKMIGQTADFAAGFGEQLQSNPRLARLVRLVSFEPNWAMRRSSTT